MSKKSGEQTRRSYIAALKTQPARYRKMMDGSQWLTKEELECLKEVAS